MAGKERAEYGERVVKRLAARLSKRFGKGFSYASVKRMKQFYVTFPAGSLIPEDLGQMQMYVNFFDRHQRAAWESPTVGFVLCSEKNSAMVRITLPEEDRRIHAPRYQLYLPTEDELREELVSERERIERARRLGGLS